MNQRSSRHVSALEVRAFLKEMLADVLETTTEAIDGETTFAALGLDSMGSTSVLVAVERQFAVRIPPSRLEDAAGGVDDATTLVLELIEKQSR